MYGGLSQIHLDSFYHYVKGRWGVNGLVCIQQPVSFPLTMTEDCQMLWKQAFLPSVEVPLKHNILQGSLQNQTKVTFCRTYARESICTVACLPSFFYPASFNTITSISYEHVLNKSLTHMSLALGLLLWNLTKTKTKGELSKRREIARLENLHVWDRKINDQKPRW